MRRLLAAAIAVLFLAIPLEARDWSSIYDKAINSVVQLFHVHTNGTCTAFSINQQQRFYLTASHCIIDGEMGFWKEAIPNVTTQGVFKVVRVVKRSIALDLALLEGDLGFPALAPGAEPKHGHELISIGYAFGEPKPWLFSSIVAAIKDGQSYGVHRRILFKDNQDQGGMSGGPVLDKYGRVVSMVQAGVAVNGRLTNVSYGTSIKQLREFARGYWRTL